MINRELQGVGHVWGAWGRQFESAHPDYMKINGFQHVNSKKGVEWTFRKGQFYVLFCPILAIFVEILLQICCK